MNKPHNGGEQPSGVTTHENNTTECSVSTSVDGLHRGGENEEKDGNLVFVKTTADNASYFLLLKNEEN